MASRTPSYIYQSPHGIWYFQVWIPTQFREKCGRKKLIRKSLGTRNRKHALRLARKLWVKVEKQKYDWEDQAEQDIAADERMYFTGKSLSAQVEEEGIDLENAFERDNFFENLTDWEIKALAFYENYQFEQPQAEFVAAAAPQAPPPLPNPSAPVITVPPSNHRLSDIVDKWIHFNTKVRNQEKRWAVSSVKKFRSTVTMMVNMVGNPLAHELTKALLRDKYADLLPTMPKGIGNKKIYHSGREPVVGDNGKPLLDAKGKSKTAPV